MKKYIAIIALLCFFYQANAAQQPYNQNPALPADTTGCIRVMKAFTPNNDGNTDRWVVGNPDCFNNIQVTVYNRWGQIAYESKDYKNNWDGNWKEKPVAEGTYFYIIVFTWLDNSTTNTKGDVTLLR